MFTLEESELLARLLRVAGWLLLLTLVTMVMVVALSCPPMRMRRAARGVRQDAPDGHSDTTTHQADLQPAR